MLRNVISNDLFTILIVVGLILIAVCKVLFAKRFQDFVLVLGNSKYLKIYSKDQKFFDVFDGLLFFNFVLAISIFGFITYNHLTTELEISKLFLLKLTAIIAILIVMKTLLERLIGSVFEIDFLIDNYLFQKISYKNFLGIILMPLNAIIIYGISVSNPIIYSIWAVIVFVFIIGIITTVKTYQNLIKQNMFYFILYLCALEIAPYIILYQLAIKN
ncbi:MULTISPECIES: DUF4271 domain-containing protein [Bizionia]|uniref:DUF4271 domain-containing protein n=1 Tax=Bizionia algoritergicola TaxID=291187 RepID=A0A5D0R1M0_9FLAO|nr:MULTISPECIES: DUF4271 domain-containing protein [Bizionia]OBX23124.1 hypothetical protein BAA08_06215 [Bizionia sp. APA-3]TYB74786.1 DUF4271 domain-containing protein [Bizionia algoritergicola]